MTRLLAAAILAVSVLPAVAEHGSGSECADRDKLVTALEHRYGERQIGRGLDVRGQLAETFVNPETGTWTLLYTAPGGVACVMGAGESWVIFEAEPPGEDS